MALPLLFMGISAINSFVQRAAVGDIILGALVGFMFGFPSYLVAMLLSIVAKIVYLGVKDDLEEWRMFHTNPENAGKSFVTLGGMLGEGKGVRNRLGDGNGTSLILSE